jgi:hypothetical protein
VWNTTSRPLALKQLLARALASSLAYPSARRPARRLDPSR